MLVFVSAFVWIFVFVFCSSGQNFLPTCPWPCTTDTAALLFAFASWFWQGHLRLGQLPIAVPPSLLPWFSWDCQRFLLPKVTRRKGHPMATPQRFLHLIIHCYGANFEIGDPQNRSREDPLGWEPWVGSGGRRREGSPTDGGRREGSPTDGGREEGGSPTDGCCS